MIEENLEYVGFWPRFGASLLDCLLLLILITPMKCVFGIRASYLGLNGSGDFLISVILPAIVTILFWIARQGTPGKMAINARIVDSRTGGDASVSQLIIRYLGYIVSTIPFGAGYIWIAISPKKQAWHDMMADTVVVRNVQSIGSVEFPEKWYPGKD